MYHLFSKKRSKLSRVITDLLVFSLQCQRLMDTQISVHISPYLSWLLCGFRKGYNAQHALMPATEKWKACLDSGGKIEAIFMDLSKGFDCIRHDLLIAKLHAYGFSREALFLVHSYLENRQQRVKINGSFSTYTSKVWCYSRIRPWNSIFQYLYQWSSVIDSRNRDMQLCG